MGAMIVAVWSAWYVVHRQAAGTDVARSAEAAPSAADEAALDAPRPGVYDRVVRVVAFLFIAVVGVAVAVTGCLADHRGGGLPAAGGRHPVRRLHAGPAAAGSLGAARQWVEASFAVAFPDRAGGPHRRSRQPVLPGLLPARGRRGAVASRASRRAAGAAGRCLSTSIVCLLVGARRHRGARASRGWPSTWWRWRCWRSSPRSPGASSARAREAAVRLSRFDPLTGLYNRKLLLRGHGARDPAGRADGPRLLRADARP